MSHSSLRMSCRSLSSPEKERLLGPVSLQETRGQSTLLGFRIASLGMTAENG